MSAEPICEHCGNAVVGTSPPDVLVAHVGRDFWVCTPCWTKASQ